MAEDGMEDAWGDHCAAWDWRAGEADMDLGVQDGERLLLLAASDKSQGRFQMWNANSMGIPELSGGAREEVVRNSVRAIVCKLPLREPHLEESHRAPHNFLL